VTSVKGRAAVWVLLCCPLFFSMHEYPFVYFQHQSICRNESGLKIITPLPRIGRFQLDGKNGHSGRYAEGLLARFPGSIDEIEAVSDDNERIYYSYSIDPNTLGERPNKYHFIEIRLNSPSAGMYVLSNSRSSVEHEERSVWRIMRGSTTYATWSWIRHSAHVFPYPLLDTKISWVCPAEDVGSVELAKLIAK